ncbi:hypothetical protein, partial [uncultured Ruminococcus sp.]|uniref:hypothetical protein n=1 Tax=uncultured Ruminococcus sp. TaxID=165186 RepID=UPI002596EDFA
VKYDGKFASRWRAKSPDALCAVLPQRNALIFAWISVIIVENKNTEKERLCNYDIVICTKYCQDIYGTKSTGRCFLLFE